MGILAIFHISVGNLRHISELMCFSHLLKIHIYGIYIIIFSRTGCNITLEKSMDPQFHISAWAMYKNILSPSLRFPSKNALSRRWKNFFPCWRQCADDLPRYDFIHDGTLFACGPAQVNASRFDALVPHQVGQQRDVVEFFEEILCIAMSE